MRKMIMLLATVLLGSSGVMINARATDSSLTLPFHENFSSSTLDAAWTQRVAPGDSLTVKGGGLEFAASAKGRAHIERPAAVDRFTFSGRLAGWASLYMVWDADNWCALGKVSPTPFGRFCSTTVVSGKATEVDHRGIHFHSPHQLRIRLGGNFVRFEYSDPGNQWRELRTVERPKEFTGAPKLIAVGKTYEASERPFANAQEGNANQGGDRPSGRISDLRVEAMPDDSTMLSEAELALLRRPKVEPVNAILSSGNDDPTFEKIVGHYPAMRYPREVLGVPAHPLDIGVDWLGRLDVSPWTPPLAWLEIGDPPVPLGRENVPFTRRLLHGYLPVLTLSTRRDGVDYELNVFGWSEQFLADKDLIAYVRLSARSVGGPLPTKVALAWGRGDTRRTLRWEISTSGHAECALRFTYPRPEGATEISRAEFEAKSRETAAFWKKHLASAGRFDVPDPRVNEAYRAWLVYSMLNADTINDFVEPHDGAGFYEEIFGCSVSLNARALDQYGLHEYAARLLDTQLHFQQHDGLYTQACGLTDPGALLVALAKHHATTGDDRWLRRVSPNIIALCRWMIRQRENAPKDGKLRGLIKFRPYNDFQYPVFNYLGNAWCARGMEVAGAALKEIGVPEGDEIVEAAKVYRRDVADSMEAYAFIDSGMTILPMEPDTHRLLKLSKYRGGDYYGLVASSLLETEFLAPNDKRASWIVDMLERRGGLIAGLCEFQEGIDHAYTYGYLMNAMRQDDVRKVLLGFWGMLAFGMTRDTYSPVEITQITTGENHLTLPHLYSCTEQLRLLRNLLLREDGDGLWIGQAIPREWLEPGKHVAVASAPTEFGDVSYRINADADGTMRVQMDPPTRRSPKTVRFRLRHPKNRPIVSVTATPETEFTFSEETIVFRNLNVPVDLRVRFKTN